jgi:hypothetical protein
VVTVVLLAAAAPGLPHFASDDTACSTAVESLRYHDNWPHALRAGASHQQDHCAICHWTRLLRAPRSTVAVWVTHAPVSSPLYRCCASGHVAPVLSRMPARAPPVRR